MARDLAFLDRDRPAPIRLLAEAGLDVLAASLAIRLTSFDRLAKRLDRAPSSPRGASAEQAYWIRRAAYAWGGRLPWRAKCFEQGVAAARMLRRRGLAYELHYGAANEPGGLSAHVWVTSAGLPVVGHENAAHFAELSTFCG